MTLMIIIKSRVVGARELRAPCENSLRRPIICFQNHINLDKKISYCSVFWNNSTNRLEQQRLEIIIIMVTRASLSDPMLFFLLFCIVFRSETRPNNIY